MEFGFLGGRFVCALGFTPGRFLKFRLAGAAFGFPFGLFLRGPFGFRGGEGGLFGGTFGVLTREALSIGGTKFRFGDAAFDATGRRNGPSLCARRQRDDDGERDEQGGEGEDFRHSRGSLPARTYRTAPYQSALGRLAIIVEHGWMEHLDQDPHAASVALASDYASCEQSMASPRTTCRARRMSIRQPSDV